MSVVGLLLSGLEPQGSVSLLTIYRVNGIERTHSSRFQVPASWDDPIHPIGSSDEPTPGAAGGENEAKEMFKKLSQSDYAMLSGFREKLNGEWNYTYFNGRNKKLIFDPESQQVALEVTDTNGKKRGFIQKFPRADRHDVFLMWNDPKKFLTIGVDGVGAYAIANNPPISITTPGKQLAPTL